MNLKYLTVFAAISLWLAVGMVIWSIASGSHGDSLFRECCLISVMVGQMQVAAILLVMGLGQIRSRVLVALLAADAVLIVPTIATTPLMMNDDAVQFSICHSVALAIILGLLRLGGASLRNLNTSVAQAVKPWQFSLHQLMITMSAIGGLCLLARFASPMIVDNWQMTAMISLVFAVLGFAAFRAALADRVAASVVVAVVLWIGASNLVAVFGSPRVGAWGFAELFVGPMVLTYFSCLVLRAFGWRYAPRRFPHSQSVIAPGSDKR